MVFFTTKHRRSVRFPGFARILGLAGVAVMLSAPTAFAADRCATANERYALDVRVLQSDLMVAALSCGARADYNDFVTRYKTELKHGGTHLKRYFQRAHGSAANSSLNRFVTSMANKSARLSMRDNGFCQRADEIFSALESLEPPRLAAYLADKDLTERHGVPSCSQQAAGP